MNKRTAALDAKKNLEDMYKRITDKKPKTPTHGDKMVYQVHGSDRSY